MPGDPDRTTPSTQTAADAAAAFGANAGEGAAQQPVSAPSVVRSVELTPAIALAVLAVVSLVVAAFADATVGWILTALAVGVGAWFAYQRHTGWPPEFHRVLVSAQLARPVASPAASKPRPQPVIPLRPLTFTEIVVGAARVVARHWLPLAGITIAIVYAFVFLFGVLFPLIIDSIFNASTTVSGGTAVTVFDNSAVLVVGFIVMVLVGIFLALPADALILGVSVIATDLAVREQPIRPAGLFTATRARIFPVCRLMLGFYAIGFLPDLLFTGVMMIAAPASIDGVIALLVVIAVISCAVGILVSLAPIVMIMENRGAVDSFRRAMQLSKPAFPRLLAIHAMWVAFVLAMFAVLVLLQIPSIVLATLLATVIAMFRAMQMLIYTDLRMRQEEYLPDTTAPADPAAAAPIASPAESPARLSAPTLVTPDDGAVLASDPGHVSLTWLPVDGATGYRVEVQYADLSGSGWYRLPGGDAAVSVETTDYAVSFVDAQRGRWRVTAVNAISSSEPSPWRTFSYTQ